MSFLLYYKKLTYKISINILHNNLSYLNNYLLSSLMVFIQSNLICPLIYDLAIFSLLLYFSKHIILSINLCLFWWGDKMRTILHIDMNNFYASVECLYRPEIRHLPVAVAGDPANRHGIILAKNMLAR